MLITIFATSAKRSFRFLLLPAVLMAMPLFQLLGQSTGGLSPVAKRDYEIGRLNDEGVCSHVLMVSPDARTVYVGLQNGTIAVWDIATRRKLRTLSDDNRSDISALALAPNGTFLISGSFDGSIARWDLASGKKDWSTRQNSSPASASKPVLSLAVSPDSQRVLAAILNLPIKVIDAEGHAPLECSLGSGYRAVGFLDNGRGVAGGNHDHGGPHGEQPSIAVWDIESGKTVATMEGPAEETIKVESTGTWLMSRFGGMVRLWRVSDVQRAVASGSVPKVKGVVIDSTILGARAYFQVPFDRWTFAGSKVGSQPDPPTGVRGVELFQLPDPITILAHDISSDGRTAFLSKNDGTIRILDLAKSNQPTAAEWIGESGLLSASGDGRFLLRSTGGSVYDMVTRETTGQRATEGAWRWPLPEFQAFLQGDNEFFGVRVGIHRPQGETSSSHDQPVLLKINLKTGASASLSLESQPVVVVSDRMSRFILLGYSRMAYLGYGAQAPGALNGSSHSNSSSALQLFDRNLQPTGHGFGDHEFIGVERAVFSPNSRMLATLGSDHVVRIFEVESAREILSAHAKFPDAVDLALTDNGAVVVTLNQGRIQSYNAGMAGQISELAVAHTEGIASSAMSPSGRLFATVGLSGSVKLWSSPSLKYLGRLHDIEPISGGGSVVFLDEDRIAAASRTGPAHILEAKDMVR